MYLDQTQKIIIGCAAVFASIVVLLLVFCLFSSRKASREELKARKAIGGRWKESNNTFDVEPLPCIEILNDNDRPSASRDSQYRYDEGGRPIPVRRGSGMAGVGTLAYKTSGRGRADFGGAGTGPRRPDASGPGAGSRQGGQSGGSAAGLSRSVSGSSSGQLQPKTSGRPAVTREGRYPGGSQQSGNFGRKPSEKKGGWRKSIERSLKGHDHKREQDLKKGHRNSWGDVQGKIETRGKSRKKSRDREKGTSRRGEYRGGQDRRKRKGSGRS
ncbi:hypothetical protein IAU59_003696 [Kwoniella sp. CBS 9459]